MLELKDLIHLPELVPVLDRIAAEEEGMVVVAGLDPPRVAAHLTGPAFLPSGRTAVLRMLLHQILSTHPGSQAIVISSAEDAIRLPRALRRRVRSSLVPASSSYGEAIGQAADRRPDLLVIDALSADSAAAALEAAAGGRRVLAQLDTVFRGQDVARHLCELGAPEQLLGGLAWVVAVRRLATLCPDCQMPAPRDADLLAEIARRYPDLAGELESNTFRQAGGCQKCRGSGQAGEVSAFDVYPAAEAAGQSAESGRLPLHRYLLGLAKLGHLSLAQVLGHEADDLHQTYRQLVATERILEETHARVQRLQAELEAANQVLQHRTEALISLESIGQALSASTSLDELAARLCRHARDLCGADRSILYHLHPERGTAEVLAESGWDPTILRQPIDAGLVLGGHRSPEPVAAERWPPGVPQRATDVTARALRAGLRVPLVAENGHVGLMIVHSSQKARFAPGEIALLKTFANQAAVAIQRASLLEALRARLVQLNAAQAELVQKERLEQELQLARQVQQSVLPHVFPRIPGYAFAAQSLPARWVGGDFYDLLQLDDKRFGIVIGDVSGKGMPAALFMAQAHSLLVAEAHRESSPRKVLANVHRLLRSLSRSSMFVTVFYGIIEVEHDLLTYARAGHDRPLLLRQGTTETLGGHGTVLGFPDMDELYLTEEQLKLCPGDSLVLFTDGLADALAPSGQRLGLGELTLLIRAHGGLPPAQLCEATFSDVLAFQGSAEQFDDMSMLILSMRPSVLKGS